jgi:spermidine synthase
VFSFPWWLSLVVGFLSLSEEIVWIRVVGFCYRTMPPAFSFVLVFFLIGIALGAVFGKRLCSRSKDLYRAASVVLGVSALADVGMPWVIGNLISPEDTKLLAPALAIIATAGIKSVLFPIVHHLGSVAEGPRVGRSVSRIYFGNILGSTLGPLVTGFFLLDHLSVDECFATIAACCLLASAACAIKSAKRQVILVTLAAAIVCSTVTYRMIRPGPGSLAVLAAGGAQSMVNWVANRHGVIHTARTTKGDFVFGGNVYDGIASTNVDTNPNNLERLYMVALVQPSPGRVLFVGLSSGAWVRSIQGFDDVNHVDVVEINPGYVELTRDYYFLAPLLKDPRIHIHVDDGRRWLRRNPGEKYDVIVQNTTYHWRANVGNLLSREYFTELRRHLNSGGIVIANTTGSFDVLATVQSVFAHAYRFRNFVYASEQPLAPDISRLVRVRKPNGDAFTLANAPVTSVASMLASARLEPVPEFLARHGVAAEIITDDNLVTEYRHGKRFGPGFLSALLPPEPAHFEFDEP